jgi:hypothetical protein
VLKNSVGWIIALLTFILTLLLYKYLTQKEAMTHSIDLSSSYSSCIQNNSAYIKSLNFLKSDIGVILIYISSIIAVVVIPTNYSLYFDWSSIPFLNWLRLIAGFLLTSYLPGYVVLKIIDKKRQIKITARIVFSIILSLSITMLVGLTLELTNHRISQYGLPTLLIINMGFLGIFLLSVFRFNNKKSETISEKQPDKKNYLQKAILLCQVGMQCLLIYFVFFTNQSFLRGDFWTHFADANNLLKYGFETQSMLSGYFWGYRIFNAAFFVLCGFPLINAEIMLAFLYPISILAFYSMVSVLLKDRAQKIPIVATVIWATFSGFDWVYLLAQNAIFGEFSFDTVYSTVSKTMSGVIYPYATFGYDHPTFVLSMTAILMLLYLFLFDYSKLKNIRWVLIAVTTLFGYIVHSPELILFIVMFIPSLLIFSKKESILSLRKGLISMLMGLALLLFLDFVAPGEPIYTTTYSLPLSIIIVCAAIPATYLIDKISLRKVLHRALTYQHTKKLLIVISLVICYLYLLSFIILAYSPLSSEGFSIGTLQKVIPWFAYPLRLGTAGILFIASVIYILKKSKYSRPILFCLAIVFFSVVFGRLYAIVYPTVVATTQDRIFYAMFIAVPIISAWIIPKVFLKIFESNNVNHSRRKIGRSFLASSFLVIVILSGSLSSLISCEFWAEASGPKGLPQQNMPHDITALSYLRLVSPSALSTVVSNNIITDSIQGEVVTLAGVQSLDSDQFSTWFGTTQPGVLFGMARLLNVNYAYLSSEDLAAISKIYPQSFFINHLIKYLPKTTFPNSSVIIYKLPQFSPPSGNSLSIVVPPKVGENIYLSIDTFASSKLQYELNLPQDPNQFEASTIVLPFDPIPLNLEAKSIVIADDNQTDFWVPTSWGYGSIGTPTLTNDNTAQINGTDCLKMVIGAGSEANWGLYHDYYPAVDWRGKETFCLYWNGANTGLKFTIEISAPNAVSQQLFSFNDNFLGWRKLVIPFNKFEGMQSKTFDLSKIGRIYIYPSSKNVSGSWFLDRAYVSINDYSLPESQIEEYYNWLNRGGHLVIFDNYDLGYFANLFGLRTLGNEMANGIANQETSVSTGAINVTVTEINDPNSVAIANYTQNGRSVSPFVISKRIGKGQITYVMAKSFYDTIVSTGNETLKVLMFSNINLTKFLNIPSSSYFQSTAYQMSSPERIGISVTNATFSGAVKINSSSVIFNPTKLSLLDFKSTNLFLMGENESNVGMDGTFSDAALLELAVNGPSTLTFEATKAQINEPQKFPESLGAYLPVIFGDGFNMTLTFPNETFVTMKLSANNSALSVVARGGIIRASALGMNSEIFIKEPHITTRGRTFFEKAWFRRPYAVYQRFLCKGCPIELNGTTSFDVPLSENNKIYLSDFTFEGTYKVFNEDLTYRVARFFSYEAWDINWSKILLSPWNIILMVCVAILFLRIGGVHFMPLNSWKVEKRISNKAHSTRTQAT